jgi:DNA sulfur modification protein DndD
MIILRGKYRREGNYAKFLKSSVNRDALNDGAKEFSVEIELSDIELPETLNPNKSGEYTCIIKRTCNITSIQDDLQVTVYGVNFKKEIEEPLDKTDFINDYLVPIEAAKFVFFDAEKIANMAELSAKEEGSVMNDALSRLLGLDVYTSLIDDLNIYCDNLKKESASESDKISITSTENTIKINSERIEKIEEDVIKIEYNVEENKKKIDSYEKYLSALGSKESSQFDITTLNLRRKNLVEAEKKLEDEFNSLFELIPFCISAGKIEELFEHLEKQTNKNDLATNIDEIRKKSDELIERLFNSPPHPIDGDISLSKKMFFAEKAKKIMNDIYKTDIDSDIVEDLKFEHDVTKADRDLIGEIYNRV